jgi:hypothetical protein
MEQYRRKPAGRRKASVVQAIQVQRPLKAVTFAVPRTRQRTRPSGALDYIRVIDAPQDANRARIGDWIVKHADGTVAVVPEEEFAAEYEYQPVGTAVEDTAVGTQDTTSEALDGTTPPQQD